MPALEIPTDLDVRVDDLASRLDPALRPLARVAYNYAWSWADDGNAVFAAVDAHRWRLARGNAVRFLADLPLHRQRAAAANGEVVARIEALAETVADVYGRPGDGIGLDGPVVFLCAEFGVHVSLPIYSGGLGVLAGDLLKEASDRALPLVGLGLYYRYGYLSQRLDLEGRQQEYWLPTEPEELPLALVLRDDGTPLRLEATLFGRPVTFQVWRALVGNVSLLLLDAERHENDGLQRWTSGRLYDANEEIRLAQYGLLGIGGARTLTALGIEPGALHLNEGHPALAPLELAAQRVEQGADLDDSLAALRERVVFTTHTPLKAGNETYDPELLVRAFGDLATRLGIGGDGFVELCRGADGPAGMSQLAMRISSRRNAVSRLHEQTAREIWEPLFPDIEIGHVTNGAHLHTYLGEPMRALFAEHLGDAWLRDPASPAAWEGVHDIPDEALWAARCAARARVVAYARAKAEQDRLLRGEALEYAAAPRVGLDPDVLTLGFARRVAGYKRLSLLFHDAARLQSILAGPQRVQLLVGGKAHPRDLEGKALLEQVYKLRYEIGAGSGITVFLEDYDLSVGRELVAGCDVWVNLPRPPLEASGTSGMKAAFNGALQLSVLDGWWAEAYDGSNGWGIDASTDVDLSRADDADAESVYSLLEEEIVPRFYDRDDDGVPHRWCAQVKEALATCAPRFSATRMLADYVERMYAPDGVRT